MCSLYADDTFNYIYKFILFFWLLSVLRFLLAALLSMITHQVPKKTQTSTFWWKISPQPSSQLSCNTKQIWRQLKSHHAVVLQILKMKPSHIFLDSKWENDTMKNRERHVERRPAVGFLTFMCSTWQPNPLHPYFLSWNPMLLSDYINSSMMGNKCCSVSCKMLQNKRWHCTFAKAVLSCYIYFSAGGSLACYYVKLYGAPPKCHHIPQIKKVNNWWRNKRDTFFCGGI